MSQATYTTECRVVRVRPKAVLLDAGLRVDIWVPRSQIRNIDDVDLDDRHSLQEIDIPEWLAEEKGFV